MEIVDESDEKLPPIEKYTNILDPFRQEWDIDGRFEMWPTVTQLAEMSNIAYDSPEIAKEKFEQLGFRTIVPIKSEFHSMVAYVLSDQDVTVVVFRGTDSKEDWATNINRMSLETKHGPIHLGFSTAYATVQGDVLDAIQKAKAKYVWTTGHSLGGALALICAYDLQENLGINVTGIITFGQPMVARQPLAKYFDSLVGLRYARFVNERDAVPRLSPEYDHCGSLRWFKDGKVKKSRPKRISLMAKKGNEPISQKDYAEIKPMSEEEFRALQKEVLELEDESLKTKAPNGPMVYGIRFPWTEDHSMDFYMDKIRKAIELSRGP